MISHLFKMIWKRKGKNSFLLLQLFVSFLALFLFIGLNLKKFSNYFKPLGYVYENAWVLEMEFPNATEAQKAELVDAVKQKLTSVKEIETVSVAQAIPFYRWGKEEDVKYKNQVSKAMSFEVDDNYQKALDIKLLEGRWFSSKDNGATKVPVVITKDLAEREFGNSSPLGQTFSFGETQAVIIGVSESFKENTSADVQPGFFKRLADDKTESRFVLKTRDNADFLSLDAKIRKELNFPVEFKISRNEPLIWLKKYAHKIDYIQLSIALIVFAFLVLNVFLGVSGVFTYNLSKRRAEVGLRVALGASSSAILKQFLGETMVLTTLGILPGVLIATQLLIMQYFGSYMDGYYGPLSLILSALFLYLLMLSCALYPSLKAAKVQPATALHED